MNPPRAIDKALLAEMPLPEHDSEKGKGGRGKLLLVRAYPMRYGYS